MEKLLRFVVSIVLCLYVAVVGSVFTFQAIPGWYANLSKPFFTPPDWLFGSVWTVLYIFMGIAFYLIWTHGSRWQEKRRAMSIFLFQLGFNAFWSMVFFGYHNINFGLVVILYLWFLILLTIIEFRKISPKAAWLLMPYLIWVGYASLLNAAIAVLNR